MWAIEDYLQRSVHFASEMLNYIVYIGITCSIQPLFVQGMDPYDHEESSDALKTEPSFLLHFTSMH